MTKLRIVMADDDRLILATLSEGLRKAGYDVREAANGKAALQLCEEQAPDLVVLDMSMPEMSGVEVAQQLNERGLAPFIFLTAYGEEQIVEIAVKEGAQGYLLKPVDISQLLPAVKAAIARSKDIKQLENKEAHLNVALSSGRETSIAVGVLMERYQLSQEDAFEALRYHARSQNRKLAAVAAELVKACNTLNLPHSILEKYVAK